MSTDNITLTDDALKNSGRKPIEVIVNQDGETDPSREIPPLENQDDKEPVEKQHTTKTNGDENNDKGGGVEIPPAVLKNNLIEILSNIRNCLSRKKKFDSVSLTNFKKCHVRYEQIFGKEINDPVLWIEESLELADGLFGVDTIANLITEINNLRTPSKNFTKKQVNIQSSTSHVSNSTSQVSNSTSAATSPNQHPPQSSKLEESVVAVITNDNDTKTVDNSLKIDSLRSVAQVKDGWFRRFELYTRSLSSKAKATTLLRHLETRAIDKLEGVDDTIIDDYEKLKKHLIESLQSDSTPFQRSLDFLAARQQAGEDAEGFGRRLLRMLNEFSEELQSEYKKNLGEIFHRGCNPALRKDLTVNSQGGNAPKDFNTLWLKAIEIESEARLAYNNTSELAAISSKLVKENTTETNAAIGECYNCHKPGHVARECPVKAASFAKCSFCSGAHAEKDCFKARKALGLIKNEKRAESKEACIHCRKTNHSSEKCFFKDKTSGKSNTFKPSFKNQKN